MLENLFMVPQDPLLRLIGEFKNDQRAGKIDLGVGVYRDESGETPVMEAVKIAEKQLLLTQSSKSYLGLAGDWEYLDLLGYLVFGGIRPKKSRFAYLQTPGGSGALRLGADIIKTSDENAAVWVGEPSWSNHIPIFTAAGLRVETYDIFSAGGFEVSFENIMNQLEKAKAGDVVLLQGCGHNPTGMDFNAQQWRELATYCEGKGLIPFIDLAYHGLAEGLDDDLEGLSIVMELVPEALVAVSCSKNFGLYRERTGALYVMAPNIKKAEVSLTNLFALARVSYSMPPDHGAAIVKTILKDPELRAVWENELSRMRARIKSNRKRLGEGLQDFGGKTVLSGKGMFSLLPVKPRHIDKLREAHAVYMPNSGRINIAGISESRVSYLVDVLRGVVSDVS